MKHPHAELMMQYAQDALETDKPWERWEYMAQGNKCWMPFLSIRDVGPCWKIDIEYRRKSKTIKINGFEVPEPIKEYPKKGDIVYPVVLHSDTQGFEWSDGLAQFENAYKLGVLHATKESAEIHKKALLSFTMINN